jgi:cytochrome c-type biogenesis protein
MPEFYGYISQISGELTAPLMELYYSTNIPFFGAFILGLAGSFAPCQLSANIGSLTYFSHQYGKQNVRMELIAHLLGRVIVYSVLGMLVTLLGQEISRQFIPVFSWSKKLLAPLMIVAGLALLGAFRAIPLPGISRLGQWQERAERLTGKRQAFLLGVIFSLGFCPTMFWLFFGLLLPMAQTSPAGVSFPFLFAVGTTLPVILLFGLFADGKGNRSVVKTVKKWGRAFTRGMGVLLVIVGVLDFLLFW